MDQRTIAVLLLVGFCFLSVEAGRRRPAHTKTKVSLKSCEPPVWNMPIDANWLLPTTQSWKFSLTIKGLDSDGKYTPGKKYKVTIKPSKKSYEINGAFITLDPRAKCEVGTFLIKKEKASPASGCFEPAIYSGTSDESVKKIKAVWKAPDANPCKEIIMGATVKSKTTLYHDDGNDNRDYHKLILYLQPSAEN